MKAEINGRDEIIAYCCDQFGITSHIDPNTTWRTIRRWKQKYRLPVRYKPNGRPFLIAAEALTWWHTYQKLRQ